MHYYKRNLGDYAKKAGRLTMLQHGSYTLLIDACYDREDFPTLEEAIEWTWASTEEEVAAVKFVLARFFSLSSDGKYVQARILEEILTYHKNAETNRKIALARESKRRENKTVREKKSTNRATDSTNRTQDVNEAPPNHKPLTISKEKILSEPDDSFARFWSAYPASKRKTSKSKCESVWKSKKLSQHVEVILEHLDAMREDYAKQGGQYCPAPLVYLNQAKWDGFDFDSGVTNFGTVDNFAGAI